jgi:hypothetical protein
MAAAAYDFEIEQGSTLLKPFVWKDSTGTPVNLSNYTAKMQIRKSAASSDVLHELSTANGRLTITANEGKVTMIFAASVSAGFTWRRGVYDLELTSVNGTVKRLLQGEITVSPEVTRD